MMTWLLNRLRGQVWARVEAPFPERVLNLCGARDLAFWDLDWESPTAFTCRLSRRDWAALRAAAAEVDCTLSVVRNEGAPFFWGKLRRRQVLLAGLAAWLVLVGLGSSFIWDFSVEGNETVPDEVILRALEQAGIRRGTFGGDLDTEDLRNHILLDIPELSWITVNVSGCRANVLVRERVPAPEMAAGKAPANVVARRDGLILRVEALDGQACVLPGTAVTEGQLLISGVEDTEYFGARVMTGMGAANARTWYSLTARAPLQTVEKRYTGKEKRLLSLVFGTRRVKFFANSSIQGENYDKITERHPLRLLGVSLPVTLVTETCRYYETAPAVLDPVRVENRAEAALTDYLHTLVDPYGVVTSTLCTSRVRGDVLEVTLSAECREDIGRSVPIYTQDPGETARETQE